MQVNLANTIISTLGNPSSLVPLAIKDTINSAGITYFSYDAGGKLEGKDRFIDEFGTMAIWLLGLPGFKWIADNTIYKAAKHNPGVDIRVAESKEHIDFAKKLLKNSDGKEKELLQSINKAADKFPVFRNLFYSKFVLATLLTFASYLALTKYKQKSTEKAITKEYLKKKANQEFVELKSNELKVFDDFNKVTFKGKTNKNSNVSFKGLQSFMFDPVKNLMIVDGGITTQRLTESRTKQEFMEYAIKESSLLFFMYKAGKWIQSKLENASLKYGKVPVDMDLRFINSKELKEAMKSPENIAAELKKFKNLNGNKEILNYIADNQESIVVKGAKISDLIATMKESKKLLGFIPFSKPTDKINPAEYIDTNDIKEFAGKFEKYLENFKQLGLSTEKYMKKARNNKIASILAGMGICCAALGYAMPKAMFVYREKSSGTKDFHVAKKVQEKLEQAALDPKI